MAKADNYKIFVDWDNDGGLNIGDFEATTEDWVGFGSAPPVPTVSSVRSKSGSKSMLLTWESWNPFQFNVSGKGFNDGKFGGDEFANPDPPFKFNTAGQGFDDGLFAAVKTDTDTSFVTPGVSKAFPDLILGRVYEWTVWVYVPTGSPGVSISVDGISGASSTAGFDAFEELSYEFTATLTEHTLRIFPTSDTNPASGTQAWVDMAQVIGPGEDVTDRVLGLRQALSFSIGRDTARSLSAIKPGETQMTLDNRSGDYSPDNPGSLLAEFLAPGRPMLIRAEWNGKIHNLFRGFLDSYDVDPDPQSRSLSVGAVDLLGSLADANLSTALYSSIQTGDAIHALLDEVGWPTALRDIDPGAATIRWWWEEGATGLEALTKIVDSEGPPALAYIDASGNLIFRDRHHRLTRTASTVVQATFRPEIEEPMFSPPLSYDIGWRDLINSVVIDVEERRPDFRGVVWSTTDRFVIQASSTKEFIVQPTDPFLNAVVPVSTGSNPDFKVESGTVESVSISRTSGQSTTIHVEASAAGPVVIEGMALRANPVTVYLSQQIHKDDSTSQAAHGIKSLQEEVPWANANDARAIADLIIGNRAERLPVVQITVKNGSDERLTQILERKLSDRIHIVEMLQTFMDHDYFVEQISHDIAQVGYEHTTVFGCERAREQIFVATDEQPTPPPAFTFNDAAAGFDDGYFDPGGGTQTATTVFILDSSTLDTDGLGY